MLIKDAVEEWFTEEYDYERPRRGQIRQGEVLKVEEYGVTVDLGLKRDGFVPRTDVELLGEETLSSLVPGQEVKARILQLEDEEGNLLLSMYQARFEEDWTRAQELLESGDITQGQVIEYNRGGLIVQFEHLRAFVPASHLAVGDGRFLPPDQREASLEAYIGQELSFKVIEVNRDRRRLILSERLASQQIREQNRERLLNELVEGQLCRGTVSRLCDFGAFVDLGGADGLVHVSELAWRRVRHPREVLQVGDEVDLYVLRLDHQRQRIGLSLKRLQPNPWELVDETYTIEQLVSGKVTNVVDFGVFVALDAGVEGLIHATELADPPPSAPQEIAERGDELVLRILSIDSFGHRMALSLKRVSAEERDEWLAERAQGQTMQTDEADGSSSDTEEADGSFSDNEESPATSLQVAEEATPGGSEQDLDGKPGETWTPDLTGQPEDEGLWTSLMEGVDAQKK